MMRTMSSIGPQAAGISDRDEQLFLRRQEELERCRMAAATLLAECREADQPAGWLVEVIVGREGFQLGQLAVQRG